MHPSAPPGYRLCDTVLFSSTTFCLQAGGKLSAVPRAEGGCNVCAPPVWASGRVLWQFPCAPVCPSAQLCLVTGLWLDVKLHQPSHGATEGQPFLPALPGGCSLGLLSGSDCERLRVLWHRQALQ